MPFDFFPQDNNQPASPAMQSAADTLNLLRTARAAFNYKQKANRK